MTIKQLAYIGAAFFSMILLIACSGAKPPQNGTATPAPNSVAPTKPGRQSVTKTDAQGVAFLESHFAELMRIKEDAEFKEIGFSQTGQYYRWLDEVQSEHNADPYDIKVGIAVGDLLMLGLAYVDSKGSETKYTTDARAQIEKVISDHKSSTTND
jgi:hypothetical protein